MFPLVMSEPVVLSGFRQVGLKVDDGVNVKRSRNSPGSPLSSAKAKKSVGAVAGFCAGRRLTMLPLM